VTIDTSQNVGIGTSSPTTKLEINTAAAYSGVRLKGTSSASSGFEMALSGSGVNAYLWNYENGAMLFATNNTERARIDSSGNVGIGTSSPAARLDVNSGSAALTADFNSTSADGLYLRFRNSGTTIGDIGSGKSVFNGSAGDFAVGSRAGSLVLGTGSTERARIDSSGNLLVGTTNANQNAGVGVKILPIGNVYCVGNDTAFSYYNSTVGAFRFYVSNAGQIFATSTSITAISDATLKSNIRDLETGLDQVMALKPRRFDWANGDGQNIAGFIAQEVEEVLPELVLDSLYSKDKQGNEIKKKTLKMGDILPTLVKAIQEQQAMIAAQSELITSLTARLDAANL
jgi:hypothetical protein